MNTSISARELFDQLQQTLALRWLAGKSGKDVRTDRNEVTSKRPSLAGYLNVIHPNKVQVLGLAELAWLDRLDARLRWENINKIIEQNPLALVISQGQSCPADLQQACEDAQVALWVSDRRGFECLNLLQHFLSVRLAPQTSLHGVFMELENGHGPECPYVHTINVKPAERVSLLATPVDPGPWAFHCHVLLHMDLGMFRVFQVSEPDGTMTTSEGAAV